MTDDDKMLRFGDLMDKRETGKLTPEEVKEMKRLYQELDNIGAFLDYGGKEPEFDYKQYMKGVR